ncbi:MAG TPA: type 4a pilus biogenesis protein PilO [Terriglobales bacterium]|jgi:type IV pilus assembly protein PilO|nr:type 4a pilus biogenesis protein PilO [Terriglobales bacterium]
MANLTDLPEGKQWAVIAGMAALLTLAAYFGVFHSMSTANDADAQKLQTKMSENAELERYRPKLVQIDQQIENLKLQLAIQERIVPDEKQADKFMRMLQGEAEKSGVEIRRYTSLPTSTKEFYTEVPFEMELDGPYYSVLNFYDRIAHLERIINISNLQMASVSKPSEAKAKHTYQYAPGESVVATCIATTFFSHDQQAAPAKPGLRPVAGRR